MKRAFFIALLVVFPCFVVMFAAWIEVDEF
jgi:hypothetical protein